MKPGHCCLLLYDWENTGLTLWGWRGGQVNAFQGPHHCEKHTEAEWSEKENQESWKKTSKPWSQSQWRHLRSAEPIAPGFHPQSFQGVRDVLKDSLSSGTHCSLRYKSECLGLKEAVLCFDYRSWIWAQITTLWHLANHFSESVSVRYPTKSLGQMGLYQPVFQHGSLETTAKSNPTKPSYFWNNL